jgi:PTS system mannose-specific IIA component
MNKALIITHGDFGKELIAVAEGIMEEKADVDYFSFDWKEDGSETIPKFERYLRKNKDHNIIIFTDMFGGSPTNICFTFKRKNIEIITGVNLPGLLKYLTYKDKDMDFKEMAKIVKKGAIEGINLISEYLGDKKK